MVIEQALGDVKMKQGRRYISIGLDLRKKLVSQGFEVGDKIPTEREIAEEYDVSRTVVREAIIMLELEGLVEVRKALVFMSQHCQAMTTHLATLFPSLMTVILALSRCCKGGNWSKVTWLSWLPITLQRLKYSSYARPCKMRKMRWMLERVLTNMIENFTYLLPRRVKTLFSLKCLN